jgi:hypothetical protein
LTSGAFVVFAFVRRSPSNVNVVSRVWPSIFSFVHSTAPVPLTRYWTRWSSPSSPFFFQRTIWSRALNS